MSQAWTTHTHVSLERGRFRSEPAGTPSVEEAIRKAIELSLNAPLELPIVIHCHAGLSTDDSARMSSSVLANAYSEHVAHTFFVSWSSDPIDTISNNVEQISQEKGFRRVLLKVAQWVASKLLDETKSPGARGLGIDAPLRIDDLSDSSAELEQALTSYDQELARQQPVISPLSKLQLAQIGRDLDADKVLRRESTIISNRNPTALLPSTHQETEPPHLPEDAARGLGTSMFLAKKTLNIIFRVIERVIDHTSHGTYNTIVEEVLRELYVDAAGKLVWSLMKKDAAAFAPGSGGAMLLTTLIERWQSGRRLVLVGHGSGGNCVAHLVSALRTEAPGFPCAPDVVLVAPANTFNDLSAHAADFQALGSKVRLFGLSDHLESNYWEFPIYRASLLYFVSGLLESEVDAALVGMERHWLASTDTAARRAVAAMIPATERVWSPSNASAPPGKRTTATTHNGFALDPEFLASLQKILHS